jgi:predicted DCC family thiol-disulfide oxidoreductase YuxK
MPTASTPQTGNLIERYSPNLDGHPILLFDGVCALCNHTVRFLLHRDPHSILRFVPLESPLGQQLLARHNASLNPDGVVLLTNGILSHRTEAFTNVLRLLPQPWPFFAGLLRLVPHFLKEFVYRQIARYRYRIFGRYDTCPIPTPDERTRIISS